jgi:hypothetical protein
MRADRAVGERKFARELERVRAQRADLEQRGIFVVGESRYPTVEAVYLPRNPLRIAVPPPQNALIALPPGALAFVEIPSLAARAFKTRFDLSDFDIRAPSVELLDPFTDRPLEYATSFRALEYEQDRKAHVVLLPDHPTTHKTFVCRRRIREYHEHPQHTGDDWMLYRAGSSLFDTMLAVWRVCVDLVSPNLVPTSQGIQIRWTAEEKP